MKAEMNTKEKLRLWVVWLALFSSLFVYFAFLRHMAEGSSSELSPVVMLSMLMAPAGASVFIRWFVIPGVTSAHAVLIASIMGMALAESLTFYGIFLFGDYFKLFFITSVLMVFQYIPFYTLKSTGSPPMVRDLSKS